MSKQSRFHDEAGPELRAPVYGRSRAAHRPASQVLRELMREFVQRQRESRSTTSSCAAKVETSRASMRALDWGGRTMKLRPNSPRRASVASQA